MTKKTHLFLIFIALSVACPIPPIKGGIPLIMWVVSTAHWIVQENTFILKLLLVGITGLILVAEIFCSGVITWLSWKANNRIVFYGILIVVYGIMIFLMTLPIYDGGGWHNSVPSKTFLQMIKTGI